MLNTSKVNGDPSISLRHMTVLIGAGVSAESGIPDFRSQGGIWDKYRPVYFDEFMSSNSARKRGLAAVSGLKTGSQPEELTVSNC